MENKADRQTTPVIDPSTVTDQEPDPAMIGNSGKVFNSFEEADAYGEKKKLKILIVNGMDMVMGAGEFIK